MIDRVTTLACVPVWPTFVTMSVKSCGPSTPREQTAIRAMRVRTLHPDLRPPESSTTGASRALARSPCSAPPHIGFFVHRPAVLLPASSPQSVALLQLRFASVRMVLSAGLLHPQGRAHAGRTSKGVGATAGTPSSYGLTVGSTAIA